MPYMTRVGRIDTNKSKVGARGYLVERRGRLVRVYWGKIEVVGNPTRFRWKYPPKQSLVLCRTVEIAKSYARQLVQLQLGIHDGGHYTKLPSGTRIYKPLTKKGDSG